MTPQRKSTATLILATIAFVVVTATSAAYVAGYFLLGEVAWDSSGYYRQYPQRWQGRLFWPAGKLESLVRGEEVMILWPLSKEDLEELANSLEVEPTAPGKKTLIDTDPH